MDQLIDEARRTRGLRRASLQDAMGELEGRGISCKACTGICCTFVANSMQLTPLEALDLYGELDARGLIGVSLVQQLEQTVTRFGLDRPLPGNGQRRFGRRRYTCPFFSGASLGCTLPVQAKPYGCLAFNPQQPNVSDGGACVSDRHKLEQRESKAERQLNAALKERLKLSWEVEAIPTALLQLIQVLGKSWL